MWRPRWSGRASTLPLLIGGATTSRVHTAVKIDPNYRRGQAVYVQRCQPRASAWRSRCCRANGRAATSPSCAANTRASPPRMHARRQDKARLPLAAGARQRAQARLVGATCRRSRRFLGTQVFDDYPTSANWSTYIDWTPFFQTWELAGKFPAILDDAKCRRRRRARCSRTRARMLDKIVARELVHGAAPWSASGRPSAGRRYPGLMPTRRATSRSRRCTRCASSCRKREGRANVALVGFHRAARQRASTDYIGAFAVTAGIGEDEVAERFKRANDDYSAILVKALADRLAEAFAERLHQRVRTEFWGYAPDETLQQRRADRGEISRHPPGARLSGAARSHREGHAVPPARRRAHRHQAHRELRHVAGRGGVRALFQPSAERAISASARSSAIRSRITRARKGWSVAEAERWLAPILNYDGPGTQHRRSVTVARVKNKTPERFSLRCLYCSAGFTPTIIGLASSLAA